MLVPKSARKKVYLHLFNNGVMVAKKVQKKKRTKGDYDVLREKIIS